MIRDYLNYTLNEQDETILIDNLKKITGGRSDIKRSEFDAFINTKLDPVSFKPRIAIHTLK